MMRGLCAGQVCSEQESRLRTGVHAWTVVHAERMGRKRPAGAGGCEAQEIVIWGV
jgi:hypothetical protein